MEEQAPSLQQLVQEWRDKKRASEKAEEELQAVRAKIFDQVKKINDENGSKTTTIDNVTLVLAEKRKVSFDESAVLAHLMENPLAFAKYLTVSDVSREAIVGLMIANPKLMGGLAVHNTNLSAAIREGTVKLPDGMAEITLQPELQVKEADAPKKKNKPVSQPEPVSAGDD